MRILHLLSQTELTGAEVYAQNLIDAQVRQGHQVFAISDKIHVPMRAPFLALSISTSQFWQRMKNILVLRKFLRENQIQIIHCHSRGAARHGFWARIFQPTALVTTLHGRQHFSWSKRLLNIYGELLIAICENVKTAHQQSFATPSSFIRVLPNPISDHGKPRQPPITSPSDFRLALLGRSSGPKGERIEMIGLSCFESWLQNLPDLEISIIAPSPENFSGKFRDLVNILNARFPGRVKLLGQIPDLRSHLANFDLNICSGRIAIESLLAETAVMACGEYAFHGIVQENNWSEVLASNFGDIGAKVLAVPLPLDEIKTQVLDFFRKNRLTPIARQVLAQHTSLIFSETLVQEQMLEIYKAAIFKRNTPCWIPILMYHKIPDKDLASQHRIFVTKTNFEKHLRFFTQKKFTTLTFRDLLEYWDLEKPYGLFPKKPLLLTFDDGYQDNLENLQPLLQKYGMKATIFLLADHQILENSWDSAAGEEPQKLMTLDEKRKLDPTVFEIGSHGFHHIHLNQVSGEMAKLEMLASKKQLLKDLKSDPVTFAYPFGSTSPELAELCAKVGYRFAVNTDQGGLSLADQPHSIFRVNVFPEDGPWQLRKKTARWYRRYFLKKRNR